MKYQIKMLSKEDFEKLMESAPKLQEERRADLLDLSNTVFTVVRESSAVGLDGEVRLPVGERIQLLDFDEFIGEGWKYRAVEVYVRFGPNEVTLKPGAAFILLPKHLPENLNSNERQAAD